MEFKMKENGFVTQTKYGELHISPDDQDGFHPFQLMVSSIVGCSATMLRKILTKMRITFKDINVSVLVERNETEARRIEKLHLHFEIFGKELRKEKIEKALVLSRKNCAMIQSVQGSIQVSESFEIVE
ncbi:OsmC family protein [Novibacillus thermophilus]|uniref:Osmotically inducible protein C n=1 Tax=Novibacillus thermophilus TaxID=1471761 RepID=A0A1U9KA42_9BACL|nr:OsmC family protein [Novibacillus thermophilus]AQS56939.1 osmotically inducible protein C [Novibacillus thermophilus]